MKDDIKHKLPLIMKFPFQGSNYLNLEKIFYFNQFRELHEKDKKFGKIFTKHLINKPMSGSHEEDSGTNPTFSRRKWYEIKDFKR